MILLTGASGYIGQKLLQQLNASGEEILVLTRKFSQNDAPNVSYVVGDLLDPASLQGKFANVTRVLHLASLTHAFNESEYFAVNLQGTRNLLAALPKNLDQFVYASTTCAEPHAGGYGESKLQVEQILREKLENLTIVRIADVFGGEGEKALEQLIARCRTWPVVPLVGQGLWQMAPVAVEDVVDVLAQSTLLEGNHSFVVAGDDVFTLREVVANILHLLGRKTPLLPVPTVFFEWLVRFGAWLKMGAFYPDQVRRLTVKKELDAQRTWRFFNLQPSSFVAWLQTEVQAK